MTHCLTKMKKSQTKIYFLVLSALVPVCLPRKNTGIDRFIVYHISRDSSVHSIAVQCTGARIIAPWTRPIDGVLCAEQWEIMGDNGAVPWGILSVCGPFKVNALKHGDRNISTWTHPTGTGVSSSLILRPLRHSL